MKIHTVEIRHVRRIRKVLLDLSAPLTVIAGPNGAGKTTVQQAILAAMFQTKKDIRDSFRSVFDPDSPPMVVLGLSHGGPTPTMQLTRDLTDDKGEWQEGATVLKKKKQALEKIQQTLPISADAAALLLWGGQADMTAVLDSFPSDGHDLLTAATIKGAGPDPKTVIARVENDIETARKGERGGQVVGSFTEAVRRDAALEEELNKARAAHEDLKSRLLQLAQAKKRRDEIKTQAQELGAQVQALDQLDKLLETALADVATLSRLDGTQTEWAGLEDEITQAEKGLSGLENELTQLQSSYRVARDEELGTQIRDLQAKIQAVEGSEAKRGLIENALAAKKRPDPAEVNQLRQLQGEIREARLKIEATGVRYELTLASGSRTLSISEDGAPCQAVVLAPGQTHKGIVGKLAIEADGLRLSARGKEDIVGHKSVVDSKSQQIAALFKTFAADTEAEFLHLAADKNELNEKLTKIRHEVQVRLGSSTLAGLQEDLARLQQARAENNMSLADKEACFGKHLAPAAEIKNWSAHKTGEISQAKEAFAELVAKRPGEAEVTLLKRNLEALRKQARHSAQAFKDADDLQREPSKTLQNEIRKSLKEKRGQYDMTSGALLDAEKKVAGLDGQLKQMTPPRSIDTIDSELQDAKDALHREEVLQQARALLVERIDKKIADMTAQVPIELGHRVTQHFSRLTRGCFARVRLDARLGVADVSENGALAEDWKTHQLSHGERHQAALAVKLAVARALAETHGRVFVMLDDSLVTFDPDRRASTEELLCDAVADGKLQVILFTCHSDWAGVLRQGQPNAVNYIELSKVTQYYRDRAASLNAAGGLAPAR